MRTLLVLLCGCALSAACLGLARLLGAGYSFREELPIFLLIFLVPVALTALARWKFL